MIRTPHDHLLSWDGPKCLWSCVVEECEYFVYEERLNASLLAGVSAERMQAAIGHPEEESNS